MLVSKVSFTRSYVCLYVMMAQCVCVWCVRTVVVRQMLSWICVSTFIHRPHGMEEEWAQLSLGVAAREYTYLYRWIALVSDWNDACYFFLFPRCLRVGRWRPDFLRNKATKACRSIACYMTHLVGLKVRVIGRRPYWTCRLCNCQFDIDKHQVLSRTSLFNCVLCS